MYEAVNNNLSSAEVFDPQTNAWTPAGFHEHGARLTGDGGSGEGKLYAAGGHDGSTSLAPAEAFDPQQNHWEAVAPMAQVRHSCGAGAI